MFVGTRFSATMTKILIVDDEKYIIQHISNLLTSCGYESAFIANSDLLLQRLAIEEFNFILLDINMSGTNGLALLQHIKQDEKLKTIDVIMLTNETDDNILAKCLELGATDYILKPVREVVLKARLKIAIERQKLLKEIKEQNNILAQQQVEISKQKDIAQTAINNLKSSLNYAYRIQQIMLPEHELIADLLPEHFVFFQPRDIVSGDFYWIEEKNNKIIMVVADCTGHGVPGAFMSMIGIEQLTEITHVLNIESPELILNELHRGIKKVLRQEKTSNRDGMDIGVCVIDKTKLTVEFSGAKLPLLFAQKSKTSHATTITEVTEFNMIRGAILPVGGVQIEELREFTKHTISLQENNEILDSVFYMYSDGYQDQFGGEQGKKFSPRRLKELLFTIKDQDMETQKKTMQETISTWIDNRQQLDDILVLGFKLNQEIVQKWLNK